MKGQVTQFVFGDRGSPTSARGEVAVGERKSSTYLVWGKREGPTLVARKKLHARGEGNEGNHNQQGG